MISKLTTTHYSALISVIATIDGNPKSQGTCRTRDIKGTETERSNRILKALVEEGALVSIRIGDGGKSPHIWKVTPRGREMAEDYKNKMLKNFGLDVMAAASPRDSSPMIAPSKQAATRSSEASSQGEATRRPDLDDAVVTALARYFADNFRISMHRINDDSPGIPGHEARAFFEAKKRFDEATSGYATAD